jgi:hypothetical protein
MDFNAIRQAAAQQANNDYSELVKKSTETLEKKSDKEVEVKNVIINDKGEELVLPGRRKVTLEVIDKEITALDKATAELGVKRQYLLGLKEKVSAILDKKE